MPYLAVPAAVVLQTLHDSHALVESQMLQTEMSCILSEVENLLLSMVTSQHWLCAYEGPGMHKITWILFWFTVT